MENGTVRELIRTEESPTNGDPGKRCRCGSLTGKEPMTSAGRVYSGVSFRGPGGIGGPGWPSWRPSIRAMLLPFATTSRVNSPNFISTRSTSRQHGRTARQHGRTAVLIRSNFLTRNPPEQRADAHDQHGVDPERNQVHTDSICLSRVATTPFDQYRPPLLEYVQYCQPTGHSCVP